MKKSYGGNARTANRQEAPPQEPTERHPPGVRTPDLPGCCRFAGSCVESDVGRRLA